MKNFLIAAFFLFYANTAFLQSYNFDDLPHRMDLPWEYWYQYSQEQVKQILEYVEDLEAEELPESEVSRRMFAYMRTLLDSEQKQMMEEEKNIAIDKITWDSEMRLGFTFTKAQKELALAYYSQLPDTLQANPKKEVLLRYLNTLPNAGQKVSMAAKVRADSLKQVEWNLRQEERYREMAEIEEKKLPIYLEYYIPACEKLHNELVAKLSRRDRRLLKELKEFYYTTLEQLRKDKLAKFVDKNGQMISPHAHDYFLAKYKLVEVAPHLCIFWCPEYGYWEAKQRHFEFACKLEYLTLKYKTVLTPLQEEKLKHKQLVREKITRLNTAEENSDAVPTLTITHDGEFAETSDYGDLWLFDIRRVP